LLAQTSQDFEIIIYIKHNFDYVREKFSSLPIHIINLDEGLSDKTVTVATGEQVFWTRLDTDDVMSISAIKYIQQQVWQPDRSIVMGDGFCYSVSENRWGEYISKNCQPHSTICIPGKEWNDGLQARKKFWCKHSEVPSRFPDSINLGKGWYCQLIHQNNEMSKMRNPIDTETIRSIIESEYPTLQNHQNEI